MASSKVSALSAITDPASTDVIYIVDDPGGTPASKKVTCGNTITKAHGLSDELVKVASGVMTNAAAGTDYVATEVDPVVGAVNGIVKADGGGNISAATAGTDYATTLQTAFDLGQAIVIANNDNQTLSITNNDTTNSPTTLSLTTTAATAATDVIITSSNTTGDVVKIVADSIIDGNILWVYSNTAGDGGNLLFLENDNTTANQIPLHIQQDSPYWSIYASINADPAGICPAAIQFDTAAVATSEIMRLSSTGLTTGKHLYLKENNAALTSGELLYSEYSKSNNNLANKTGAMNTFKSVRVSSRTSGTTADDYDLVYLIRDNRQTDAGGTLTAAGSCLRIENVATQTAGTLTDTVKGIEIVMDTDGTGEALHATGQGYFSLALKTGMNVGTANTGITAAEYGDGYQHVSVLTVSQTDALTLADNASLADGYLLYTFPAGAVVVDYAYMTMAVQAAGSELPNDTPDVGLGTVIASGAVATLDGTATFENIITGQTAADANGTATVKTALPTAGTPFIIESGDAHTLHFNVADAWADDTGGDLTADISGTVVVAWRFMA